MNLRNKLTTLTRSILLILSFLAVSISVSAQEGDSCKLTGVDVGFTVSMCSHNPYTITFNDKQVTGTGDCTAEQWVTSALTYTKLKVDEPHTLTVGSDSCSTHVNFIVPDEYYLEIDGVEATSIDKVGTTEGGGDGSWTVVLRKKCPCDKEKPGESGGAKRGSVLWQVGMGSLTDGSTAHSISLREEALSAFVYTPAALIYSPPGRTTEVDVVRNGDQSLRQVKAPQTLANIIVINATEYEIRFYRTADVGAKVGGLYTVTGQPFVTWNIKNPEPSSLTKLQITKTQGAITDTSLYTWDAISGSWILSTGNGARIETSTTTYPTPTSRVETAVIKDNNNFISSKISKTFHTFAWGERLIQEVLDPDGAALKTVYSYYENGSETGRYSRLKSIVNPDGSWELYDYDSTGNKVLVLRPWKDQSIATATEENSHATRYTYTNSDGIITSLYTNLLSSVTEKIAGITVRKTTYSRTGTTVNGEPAVVERQTAYSSLTETLVTTSTRYHATAVVSLANRSISTEYPDGRKDSVSYEKGNYITNANPALSAFTPDTNGLAERETTVHGTVTSPLGVQFKTTKETSVRDQNGNEVLTELYVYNGTDYDRVGWTVSDYDHSGHIIMSRNHKGEVATAVFNGEQKTSDINAGGIETTYTYDSLGRVKTQIKKGIAAGGGFPAQADVTTTINYDAEGRQTGTIVSSGSLSLTSTRAYDRVGRLMQETDGTGLNTTYLYANGGRTTTVLRPGGVSEISDKYLDGQSKSVTGSGVVASYFDYGVNADGTTYTQEFAGPTGLSSPRSTMTTVDWMGREVKVEKPGFTGTNVIETSIYNTLGQLQKRTVMAVSMRLIADRLYEYDELGRQTRIGLDIDGDGALTLASTDRINEAENIYEKVGNDWFRVSTTRTYLIDNSNTPTTRSQRERLNNFALNGVDQTVSETTSIDAAGNSTVTTVSVDRNAKKQTTIVDTPDANVNAIDIVVNGLLQSSLPTTPQSATTYLYDSLGRVVSITSPQSGTSTSSYSATTGQLTAFNDGTGDTLFDYYPETHISAGKLMTKTNAAGKKIYFNYNSRGELVQTWGDATYPLEYVYDSYGQRTELHTFRGGQNWGANVWPAATTGTADVTKWIYHEATGLLTQKQDAALKGPIYTYDELGRLKTRLWARGITTTYGYDSNTGELRTITYSDSTPAVSFTYDRGGRQNNITDPAGSRARTFTVSNELQTEQITGGLLDGVGVTIAYDTFLRRQSLQTSRSANTLSSQSYGYDPTSRLQTITSDSQTAAFAYHPDSGLLNTTTFTGGTSIGRSYDSHGRLETITTMPAADSARSYTYTYNNLNQRTRVTREDGSYWSFIYNDRGELVSGKKYWSDNSIVWGAQTEYNFDNIGNRKSARNGGNQLGSLRESTYTANSLNQYTQRSVPGAVDVTGAANTAATVTVNNEATVRKGEYFYKELAVNNSTGPVYSQINVIGARNSFGAGGEDAVTTSGGRAFVPGVAETFTYDDDGNMTSDGRWNYVWDAENRLVSMEATNNVPVEAKQRLEYSYMYPGQRIQKNLYSWNAISSSYQLVSTTKFIYDGWSVMAEIDGSNVLIRSNVRNGRELLFVQQAGNINQFGHDGNQNVGVVVRSGQVVASYEYDPFGQTIVATGSYARQNPWRFSDKYTDDETGLVYYGYRYYQPSLGKWINRDPSGEAGAINLNAFLNNDGLNYTDFLGLWRAEGYWEGGWGKYEGIAVAGCKDTLGKLAELITGYESDWRALGRASDKVNKGEKVDISPLLELLEKRLRWQAVRNTRKYNPHKFEQRTNVSPLTAASLVPYFSGSGISDCSQGVLMVYAQAMVDVFTAEQFDKLGIPQLNSIYHYFKQRPFPGEPGEAWVGDSGFIENYPEYADITRSKAKDRRAGPSVGDNYIKVSRGLYWVYNGQDDRVKTVEGWKEDLREAYRQVGGNPQPSDGYPNSYGPITFLDTATIARQVFEQRNKK